MYNIILDTDSYKVSHHLQYPPGTTHISSYIESRYLDRPYTKTLFFGLQAYLKKYLEGVRVTSELIDEAEEILSGHGFSNIFHREGWEYIIKKHGGLLPVEIKAIKEGTILPNSNVMLQIVNTDPNCFWLTSYLETSLLRAVWYPSTVATTSFLAKRLIKSYLEETADDLSGLNFKLHDFGYRGVSSQESGILGGMAHLVNFEGTDTIGALLGAKKFYGSKKTPGFSIPAAEHSTITAWGKENELKAFSNMLTQFAKPNSLVAVVSDSYDIYKASEKWGSELKDEVLKSGATVVIRPDSGNPVEVTNKVIEILAKNFGYTENSKGFKVLKNVRIIQGDGVNLTSIAQILEKYKLNRWSADNIAFGMGAGLLQEKILKKEF